MIGQVSGMWILQTSEVNRGSAKWRKKPSYKVESVPVSVIYPIIMKNVVEKGE